MSDIDDELQGALYRSDARDNVKHFIENYYESYKEFGISLESALMIAKLRDIDITTRRILEFLEETDDATE